MKYGSVAGVAKPVSRLVQGTVMLTPTRREAGFELLDGVFERGCTCFDSAHVYGNGDCERVLGEWVRSRGIEDRVAILDKGAHPYEGRNRVTPHDIRSDCMESLGRLGLSFIDLYLLHRDDPAVPVSEIVDTLENLANEGLIGAYGGSNWTVGRLREAAEYAARAGRRGFAASSPQFGLAWPQKPVWEGCVTLGGPRNEPFLEAYRQMGIATFAWSSLGGGWFSGRFRRGDSGDHEDYFDKLCWECYAHEENFNRLERAEELARHSGCSPALIALAWLMHQDLDCFALVGCRSVPEFAEDAAALDAVLPTAQVRWLTEGGPESTPES